MNRSVLLMQLQCYYTHEDGIYGAFVRFGGFGITAVYSKLSTLLIEIVKGCVERSEFIETKQETILSCLKQLRKKHLAGEVKEGEYFYLDAVL